MHLGFKVGSGMFQGRDLTVEARWAQVVDLLQARDCAVFVHDSSDTFDAVVEDVFFSVTSLSFAFPQMSLVQLELLSLDFLDFRS